MRDPLAGDSYTYAGSPTDNTITDNSIRCTRYGVNIRGGVGNEVSGNDIGGALAGVYLQNSTAHNTTGTDVCGNRITGNTTGILTDNASNTAQFNTIQGNTMGVSNTTLSAFDARYNWWGAINGPGPVGPGSGDRVSAHVTYTPWLTAPGGQINVTLELERIVTTPVVRSITFLTNNTSAGVITLVKSLTFTNRQATTTLCFPTQCLSVKDEQHTLFSRLAPVSIGGAQYVANFTGTHKLLGGDANDDDVIDVIDFGIFMAELNLIGNQNADFDDSGMVDPNDFLIFYPHFSMRGTPPCGSITGQLPVPKTSITVANLAPYVGGLINARKADLNNDGRVNAMDIAIYLQRISRGR